MKSRDFIDIAKLSRIVCMTLVGMKWVNVGISKRHR